MVGTQTSGKIKKWMGAAIILLLAASVIGWLRIHAERTSYPMAAIYVDGEQAALIDLADYTEAVRIPLSEFGVDRPVEFELKDHRIRFINVDCPDKICEHYGFIYLPTQTAVCMPNRVSVSIVERP